MLSDAPAHHLFCLLPPVPPTQNSLPEVLAVVQVLYDTHTAQCVTFCVLVAANVWLVWFVFSSSSPQVCLEGEISRQSILNSLSRGRKASGDLIPWTVSEQVHTSRNVFHKTSSAPGSVVKPNEPSSSAVTVSRPRLWRSVRRQSGANCCQSRLPRGKFLFVK